MLRTIEVVLAVLAVTIVVWQIMVPLLRNRPVFPLFNRRRREAEHKIVDAQDQAEVAELEERARKVLPTASTERSI